MRLILTNMVGEQDVIVCDDIEVINCHVLGESICLDIRIDGFLKSYEHIERFEVLN